MDLVSGIRKTGSRGGVNFNWEDVTTSAHRENYLGHSLKAPVGRWQKGRDLTWYAKGDAIDTSSGETLEEKAARERKEELQKIKEAEEEALARALGLPIAPRNVTGANAVDVTQSRITRSNDPATEAETLKPDESHHRASKHHGEPDRRHRRRHRSQSRDRDRDLDRRGHRDRNRDRDGRRDRSPRERHATRRSRSRDGRDDRRGDPRQRSGSREKEPQMPSKLYRGGRDRSHSIDRSERRRRTQRDGRRSTSRDRRGSKSPQRYRRRSPERD
ncbi:kinase phosphorylation protein-domain-containing protein [Nemania serpens]|nr:kinase phosphorylation protein-domain-containing protein [Nemania serpens]